MKAIWTGSLSFGLVSIAIRLYSAIQEHTLGFKLLCKTCHTPIVYERWCKHCKKEVSWENIVKGLKLEDGSYFILTQEKLKELKPERTDTIDIVEFVPETQIQPIYLENHYYIAPEKNSIKPFFLFKQALQESGKVAIGNFVMRDKQYACVINPYGDALLLTTLHYAYEIRSLDTIDTLHEKPEKTAPAELKLALQLINQLTVKKFKLEQFKDTFAQQLKEAIKKGKREKIKNKQKVPKTRQLPKREKESSLMTSLRASLQAPGKGSMVSHAPRAKSLKRK